MVYAADSIIHRVYRVAHCHESHHFGFTRLFGLCTYNPLPISLRRTALYELIESEYAHINSVTAWQSVRWVRPTWLASAVCVRTLI